ncbi:ABC transporter substrate-binding protein [Streptomyces phytophilus]|uniref:ABC transporter substrate-binding protein n=1 Tax=Streptomyces phytophilus TaxID=722715 RepID=UPI001C69201F|nr:ABC transporter substrate-binding protein [Streptomyces phytophilus]
MENPLITNRVRARAAASVLAAAALTAGLAACGGDSLEEKGGTDSPDDDKSSLVVGQAGFTVSTVTAELYSAMLKDAGHDVTIKKLENRELYEPELEKGSIDVFPEYAATLAEFLNAKENGVEAPEKNPVASNDADETVTALRKLAEPRGLKVLDAGDAVDQNAFAVSKDFAAENDLKTLSDLGRTGDGIRLAAGDECPERPFCEPGLEKTYDIDITKIDPLGVGTPAAKQSVQDGTNQLALTTTTDATLDDFDLVLLEDDKGLQNADNILPVVNAKEAGTKEIAATLDKLTRVLTTDDLIELNRKVDAERMKPADAAKEYLEEKNLLGS